MENQYCIQEYIANGRKKYLYSIGDASNVKETLSNSFLKMKEEEFGRTIIITKKAYYLALLREWPEKEEDIKEIERYSNGQNVQVNLYEKFMVFIFSWLRK